VMRKHLAVTPDADRDSTCDLNRYDRSFAS
jgi:hypothetical protein